MYFDFKKAKDLKAAGAYFVGVNMEGILTTAASSRISTTQGTALEIFLKTAGISEEENSKLVSKVLGSGHRSVMEHLYFNIAFNNVSVVVEQFLLENRLSAVTVQSRRYVDFSKVGVYVPDDMSPALQKEYSFHMTSLFKTYEALRDTGIPIEDCRFVLPYCYHSNWYYSCNARELLHIICSMIYGYAADNDEIIKIGTQLKEQFDKFFPGLIDKEKIRYQTDDDRYIFDRTKKYAVPQPKVVEGETEIVSWPEKPEELIKKVSPYNWAVNRNTKDIAEIIKSLRPRELEMLNFGMFNKNVTLSTITHYSRHRIQTQLMPHLINAILENKHILPETIKKNPEALKLYTDAFSRNTKAANELLNKGMDIKHLLYFSLSGNTMDFYSSMNARELMHFFSVRACNRSQWEIRGINKKLLPKLIRYSPEIFGRMGPSCYLRGYCPEGKLSCGKMTETVKEFEERKKENENGKM